MANAKINPEYGCNNGQDEKKDDGRLDLELVQATESDLRGRHYNESLLMDPRKSPGHGLDLIH